MKLCTLASLSLTLLSPLSSAQETKLVASDGTDGDQFGDSVAIKGGVNAGDTKRYQLWYRDSGGSPCDSEFNLTNGYEITWTS